MPTPIKQLYVHISTGGVDVIDHAEHSPSTTICFDDRTLYVEPDCPSPTFSQASTQHGEDPTINEKTTSQVEHQIVQPDEGTQTPNILIRFLDSIRWPGILALIAGCMAQMLCWGLIMTYGTILAYYVRFLIPNVSETLIALAGSIPPFLLLSLAILWGRLLDAGHHRRLHITAGTLLVSGLIALSFTGSNTYNSGKYYAILLASIPMGIGQSIYFLSAPHLAKTWHPKHKGLAMGITNSGAALGGVAWPLIFDSLVASRGYREAVGTLAGISTLMAMFIIVFGKPAPEFTPNQVGQLTRFKNWWPSHAFRSTVFVIHIVSMCFIYLGILGIPFFIEIWARRKNPISVSEDVRTGNGVNMHRSRELGVYLVITLNACQLPGRLLGSTLCDKFRARKIHAVACLVACILIGACWFSVSSFEGGVAFAGLYGSTFGVMASLPINDVQDLLGNGRTHLLGQYAGTVYTCCSPFMLAGGVLVGLLVAMFDVDVAPAVWCMVCFGLGAVLIVVGLVIEDDTGCFEGKNGFGGLTRCPSVVDVERAESIQRPDAVRCQTERYDIEKWQANSCMHE